MSEAARTVADCLEMYVEYLIERDIIGDQNLWCITTNGLSIQVGKVANEIANKPFFYALRAEVRDIFRGEHRTGGIEKYRALADEVSKMCRHRYLLDDWLEDCLPAD